MKIENKIIMILFSIMCVFMSIIIAILVDFYNDYKCSINRDPEYWKEHNCIKYCKECEEID